MRNKAVLICAFLLATVSAFGQGIPSQWEFTNNYTQLQMGKQGLTGPHNDSLIRKIDLVFPQTNYWQLLTANKNASINIPATLTYEGNKVLDSVGVRFKGNTSYSRVNSDKKSFNIEVDWIKSENDIGGYHTFNLNNAYGDESFLREVMYTYSIRRHVPGLKASFSWLTINGQDWGLYPNIQQLNKDMYSDWFNSNDGVSFRAQGVQGGGGPGGPNWGDGTTALNDLGSNPNTYQTYYVEKYSDYTNPYTELMVLCDKLNNTPLANLEDTMKVYMDLDRTLWFLASEIAFTDDDGYVYKGKQDYYVFKEMETGQAIPMEFDGNSAMATNKINWSPFHNETNVNYPLLNRLLSVPSIRQRYLAHMRTIIAEELDQTAFDTRIDHYVSMIDTAVQNDTKKLYSYNDFLSEVTTLKNFVASRRNSLNGNTEVSQAAPNISTVAHYSNNTQWARPSSNQTVDVRATINSTNGISAVNIYYSNGINGQFTKALMYDDGAHNDGAVNDGVYGAAIPGFVGGTWVRYYVEAVANNAAQSVAYMPVGAEHDVYVYLVEPAIAADKSIVINEIMAANDAAVQDNNGEFDDWIEIHNSSTINTLDISGWTITDDQFNLTKHVFPAGTTITPEGYYILWADEDGSQGANHANFKLSASGEELLLLNANMELVDELTWSNLPADQGYARSPNATGNFIVKYQTHKLNNDWALGVENVIDASQVILYPNPANDFVTIELSKNAAEQLELIELLDITGKKMRSVAAAERVQLSTAELANGMYILRFGNVSKKFVVQHQ